MYLRLPLPLLALLFALASLAAAPAAVTAKPLPPPSFVDTATASGDNVVLDDFSVFDIHVEAFSGPSGEDPGGLVSFDSIFILEPVTGPVSCLNVAGNTAVMTVAGPFPSFPGVLAFTVKLVDNGGSGLNRFQYFPVLPEGPQYLDCRSDPPADFGGPLTGRAEVFDAPPPPSSAAPSSGASPTPADTGQREAALKKCKKKHSKTARKRCRKKAKLLTV
jgi:hypothetical protein